MINADNLIQANNLNEKPGLIPKKVSFVMRQIETPTRKKARKSKLLEKITDHNDSLIKNLENLKSTTNCLKDMEQFKSFTSLANELTDLQHQVETEKSYLEDLVQQIRKLENQKKKQSKRLGGNQATQVNDVKQLDKSRERWQEKLRVESVHLGNEMTKNKELREKIRCMMSERSKFNKEYDDLLEKLRSGKEIMKDVVESVKLADGQRKNILTKIEKINFQENKQIALHEEEAYNLNMRKLNEHELCKFYFNKQKERPSILSEQEKSGTIRMSEETVLHDYRNLMLAIVEKVEEPDASAVSYDGIVKQLKNNESEILSLFKHATRLNHEMEVLKDKLVEQGKQINEMTSDQDMKTMRNEDALNYLTGLKKKIEEDEMQSRDDIKGAERLLARLFEGIDNLISTTKADISPLLLLLGENEKVTVFNYKLFMEALEAKLIAIMNSTQLQLRNHFVPSFVSFSKGINILKGKSGSSNRAPDAYLNTKIVITNPCLDCTAHKKEIEGLSKPIINGTRVKVY